MTLADDFLTSAADKLAENLDRIETCLTELPPTSLWAAPTQAWWRSGGTVCGEPAHGEEAPRELSQVPGTVHAC